MEIRQIKYFIQVCNDNSFSKAAENLHISQQGLSKTIKNLEDELKMLLFERSSKGVKPTVFGNLLLEKSHKIVNEFDLMVDFLYYEAKIKKGTISLGVPLSLHTNYIAAMLCEFQETYPDIKLDIVESGINECEKDIANNLLDIFFSVRPVDTEKFLFISLFSCGIMLLVNKDNPLAQKNAVKFKDLENEKFIMLSSEYKSRQLTIECCLESGFKPNIFYTASQIERIIELVALNKGIAILPEPYTLSAIKSNDSLSVIPFQDTPFKLEIGIIINRCRSLSYNINTLINYFLKFFKDNEVY